MNSPKIVGFAVVLALSGALLSSCSGSGGLYPVRGKVLLNNEPIKGAVVFFHPKGTTDLNAQHPSGVTGADGAFTLMTGSNDGAAPGDYEVTVVWHEEPEAPKKIVMSAENQSPPRDRLNGRYANPTTSKLTAQVKNDTNVLEPFRLD